jgi:DNA-binding transcriptional ArsR family regulator
MDCAILIPDAIMAESPKSDPVVLPYQLPTSKRTLPVLQGHDCVAALRALGEDTRVRIVGLLINEALDVGQISHELGVSPYNVSKHLRILREAGLLEVEKSGRQHRYSLADAIRRRATAGGVLDLGCCSFKFEVAPKPVAQAAPTRRRSSVQRSRRVRKLKARASD